MKLEEQHKELQSAENIDYAALEKNKEARDKIKAKFKDQSKSNLLLLLSHFSNIILKIYMILLYIVVFCQ